MMRMRRFYFNPAILPMAISVMLKSLEKAYTIFSNSRPESVFYIFLPFSHCILLLLGRITVAYQF